MSKSATEAIQHNTCGRGNRLLHSALNSAIDKAADAVLLEPPPSALDDGKRVYACDGCERFAAQYAPQHLEFWEKKR